MGWTYVKVLLTSLNCHAATSGFHQGLWERQVSRTEWFSDALYHQYARDACFDRASTHWVKNDLLQAREGSVSAGGVKGRVDVKVGRGAEPTETRAQVLPRSGWGGECAQSCSILTRCKCVCGERWCEGTPSAAPPGSSSRKTDLQQQQQQQHEQPAASFGAAGTQI